MRKYYPPAIIILAVVALGLGCGKKEPTPTAAAPTAKTAAPTSAIKAPATALAPGTYAANGLTFSIIRRCYTDAAMPRGNVRVGLNVTNSTNADVELRPAFNHSRLAITGPDGRTTFPVKQPPREVNARLPVGARNSYNLVVDIGLIYLLDRPGDYVLRWELEKGVATFPFHVIEPPAYFAYRLNNDTAYNDWGLYNYGEDGLVPDDTLAAEALKYWPAITPDFAAALDDGDLAPSSGPGIAQLSDKYMWRVCDLAAIILATPEKADFPDLRSKDPAVRDRAIALLKAKHAKKP